MKVNVLPHDQFERKGDDLYSEASVNMFTPLLGGKQEINTLSGKVNINLPAGTQNGKQLRLKGKGMPVYGRPSAHGDLYVKLMVKLPEHLTEEQKEQVIKLKNMLERN